jgi:hypothetical protein
MAGEYNTTTFLPLPIDLFSAFLKKKRNKNKVFLLRWNENSSGNNSILFL